MFNPTQLLLKKSIKYNSCCKINKFSLNEYKKNKLNQLEPKNLITNNYPLTEIQKLVLISIQNYQFYKKLNIENYKISLILTSKSEKSQLPKLPNSIDNLFDYIYNLILIPNFELTDKNQILKSNLLTSLNINDNQSIIKLLLINEILNCSNSNIDLINKYFKNLKFDNDIFFIIYLLYFINPNKLNKIERFIQILNLLLYYKINQLNIYKIDWDFLNNLINSNILSINLNNYNLINYNLINYKKSFILNNLIELINKIQFNYINYNLIDLMRLLRNAEIGYENNENFKLYKFNISYYRYLLLNKLINEWNKNNLTNDKWIEKNLYNQWLIIYKIYYENENSIKPGGITIQNKIKEIINNK